LPGGDVRAYQTNLTRHRDASSTCICIGDSPEHENGSTTLNTVTDGDPGVLVTAEPRLLKGVNVNIAAPDTNLVKIVGKDRLALFVEAQHTGSIDADSQTRSVNWDSDVLIHSGPTPELHIASDGSVITAINISVNGTANPAPGAPIAGNINVGDIVNDDPGQVVFQAGDGGISGGFLSGSHFWGTFEFRDTYQQVRIQNDSSKTLTINDVKVFNSTEKPLVELVPTTVTVNFKIVR